MEIILVEHRMEDDDALVRDLVDRTRFKVRHLHMSLFP